MRATTLFMVLVLGVISVGSLSINDAYGAAFVKYAGIDGESTDASHDKWIDVLSVDFGVTRAATGGSAPVVQHMVITMEYDKASPKILEKALNGEVIPKLEIELTATTGGSRATYLKYELVNVLVTSYQTNASGDDLAGLPTVVVGNNFEEIKVTYTEFDSEGNSKGDTETSYRVKRGSR